MDDDNNNAFRKKKKSSSTTTNIVSSRRKSLDNSELSNNSESSSRGSRGSISDEKEEEEKGSSANKKVNNNNNNNNSKQKAILRTYPNDDTYVGYLDPKTSSRTGFGCYYSKYTGCTYTGEFVNNTRHGYGILLHPQLNGKYVGEFVNDHKHGTGTLLLNNTTAQSISNGNNSSRSNSSNIGSCYHGNFVHGTFDGFGTYMCNREGISYVGEFKGGVRHGVGLETYADGRVYHGEYKNGKRDGYGTLLEKSPLRSKIIYTGCWHDGFYHGRGTSIQRHLFDEPDNAAGTVVSAKPKAKAATTNKSQTGDDEYAFFEQEENDDICQTKTGFTTRFQGEFVSGKRQGFGTLTSDANNITWKGMWDNGQPISGKWRIEYKDGQIFSGHATVGGFENYDRTSTPTRLTSYNNDVNVLAYPDGFGTLKYANGDVYVGTFKNGVRSGSGCLIFSSGDKWDGIWINDHLNENEPNTLTMSNGTVHEFSSDKRSSMSSNFSTRMGLVGTDISSAPSNESETTKSPTKEETLKTKSNTSWSWFY